MQFLPIAQFFLPMKPPTTTHNAKELQKLALMYGLTSLKS